MNKAEAKRLMNRIDKVLYGHVEDDVQTEDAEDFLVSLYYYCKNVANGIKAPLDIIRKEYKWEKE